MNDFSDDEPMKEYRDMLKKYAENILTPMPDTEAVRTYWDETTQSVKQEIIQLADMQVLSSSNNRSDDDK